MKAGGYVALYRTIWDNKKLEGPFSKREAWIWLFSSAAWEPVLQRAGSHSINVHRGQIAATMRMLAVRWQWPLGRTQRFIGLLRRERMISVELPDSTTDSTYPHFNRHCMVISICNYKEFQPNAKSRIVKPIQQPIRQKQGTMPFVYVLRPEEPNNIDSSLSESGKAKAGRKRVPKTGQQSKFGTMFIAADHPQYGEFADDYRAATGHGIAPVNGGNWFWPAGEASRPPNLTYLRPKPTARASKG